MKLLVILVTYSFLSGECADKMNDSNLPDSVNLSDSSANMTDPAKDMYVIHATVYQVGILTNSTGNMTDNFNTTGNQESVTLYHTNGTNVDLSAIPEPFQTNVTAQTLVGVAPILDNKGHNNMNGWNALNQLTHLGVSSDEKIKRAKKSVYYNDIILHLFKRDTSDGTLRVVNGAIVIPPEAGIQSISLPPLLSLDNNLTEIPVPIPNTSVVHYAKVNTLIQKP